MATGLDVFVGSLLQAAEGASKAATDAADQWVNSGWQLKKRSGRIIPEIRPNANNVGNMATQWLPSEEVASDAEANGVTTTPIEVGLAGPSGSLAKVDAQASAILSSESAIELQGEFCAFLAPREGKAYSTTAKGEIVFASRDALAALVAEFSYAKLRELAAAARALSRYVDDLESAQCSFHAHTWT